MRTTSIIERFNRNILIEGVNRGLGFGIWTRDTLKELIQITPVTCCRDFFNDFSIAEFIKPVKTIYNYKHVKTNIFNRKKSFLLSLSSELTNNKKLKDELEERNKHGDFILSNAKNLVANLNKVIKAINPELKEIKLLPGNFKSNVAEVIDINSPPYYKPYVFLELPTYWIELPHRISFITQLIRFIVLNDKELVLENLEDLDNYSIESPKIVKADDYTVKSYIANKNIITNYIEVDKKTNKDGLNTSYVHDKGFLYYLGKI